MIKDILTPYKWTFIYCAVLLAALLIPARTEAQTHINVSWQQVLKQENHRIDSLISVLGLGGIGIQINRIKAQSEVKKTMQKEFTQLPKDKVSQAKNNYNRLKALLAKNPLFQGYELAVPVARDLYQIKAADFKQFLAFCDGTANPVSARKYKQGLFLTLQANSSAAEVLLWVDVQKKILSFVYNDPADLEEFLTGKWYELNVR